MTETKARGFDRIIDSALNEIEKEKSANGGTIPTVNDPVDEWVELMKTIL